MGKMLSGRPLLTTEMFTKHAVWNYRGGDKVWGNCAHCGLEVWEYLCLLDDSYAVWRGECPKCKAINLLDLTQGLRGYSSQAMCLCLPCKHEVEMNEDWTDVKFVRECTCSEEKHAERMAAIRKAKEAKCLQEG